jgi:hypothetical protein
MPNLKEVPGCGNYNSATSVCKISTESNIIPTFAIETQIEPLGSIESPFPITVLGYVCTAIESDPNINNCTHFTMRTEKNNIDDFNI